MAAAEGSGGGEPPEVSISSTKFTINHIKAYPCPIIVNLDLDLRYLITLH
jgi:hypothetical protein